MTPQKTNTQKSLRSLNDVLGKSSTAGKDTKAVPGHPSPTVHAARVSPLTIDRLCRRLQGVFRRPRQEGPQGVHLRREQPRGLGKLPGRRAVPSAQGVPEERPARVLQEADRQDGRNQGGVFADLLLLPGGDAHQASTQRLTVTQAVISISPQWKIQFAIT